MILKLYESPGKILKIINKKSHEMRKFTLRFFDYAVILNDFAYVVYNQKAVRKINL